MLEKYVYPLEETKRNFENNLQEDLYELTLSSANMYRGGDLMIKDYTDCLTNYNIK